MFALFYDNGKDAILFIDEIHNIVGAGSNEETPLFMPLISSILDDLDKCLPIQRHKYEIKTSDSVMNNKYIVTLIDTYKKNMGL